jgi:hypothetical protein
MQTLKFTRAMGRIVTELKAVDLVGFLEPFLVRGQAVPITQDHRNAFSGLLFESRVGFAELMKDEDAAKILQALAIGELYSPARLGKLLATFNTQGSAQSIWGNPDNFADFFGFVDMLSRLLKLSGACSELLDREKVGPPEADTEIVEVELVDYDGSGIEVERVSQLFASLNVIHLSVARVLGMSDAHLKVLFLDSGTNFLIGLRISKAVGETLGKLLKEFWDKVKYRKFDEFDRKIESLSKGLSFSETVQLQIEKKIIDEETGNILKYRVLSEMTTLVGIGAMPPPDKTYERIDERKLLSEKRGVKLLGTGETPTKQS